MNTKDKFSTKVNNYSKYRPSYPDKFIEYLIQEVGLNKDSIVADIGAGTGRLTRLLAEKVKTVLAIEPNLNMRQACLEYCRQSTNVIPVDGSAESTTLADSSVDFITVAQAFHWFDKEKSKSEFGRILKPGGKVTLVWNKPPETQFGKDIDALYHLLCPDYKGRAGGSELTSDAYQDFFKKRCCDYRVFDNSSESSLANYLGGSLSASYAPSESDANYAKFVAGVTRLFQKYQTNGKLLVNNQTHSYTGLV
jgi:ubiquinone/menaquinone biosynthesis C-methylase UbiE